MCRKLTYLISFVLVLGLAGSASAGLVAHWKFDGNLSDSAGSANGTFVGGTTVYADGKSGKAISFDGVDDFVNIPSPMSPAIYAIALWVKPARTDAASIVVRTSGVGPTSEWSHQLRINPSGAFHHYLWVGAERNIAGTTTIVPDTWYHVVIVAQNNGPMRLYVNGQEDGVSIDTAGTLWGSGDRIYVGSNSGHSMGWFKGLVDDLRIYDRELTASLVKDLFNGIEPAWVKAEKPNPPNGATGITSPLLQWKAGDTAAYHDVYFGTNPNPGPAEYKGRQGVNTTLYYHVAGLTPGTTYYWRIDEIEADETTIYTGDVWSFTAPTLTAWRPSPADGAEGVFTDVTLRWNAGWNALIHHVYLGESYDDVDNGTADTYKGIVTTPTTYATAGLRAETTYYWRVDESVDSVTWRKGDIWSFTTVPAGTGRIIRQWWSNIGAGTAIGDLTGNANYPDNPTGMEFVDLFEGPVDWMDNYGSRLCGWLFPPVTGNYTFWIATDDAGQLWLSTDADPANKVLIASVSGWVGSRDFDNNSGQGGTNQKSAAISLQAGKVYYIEAMMKEGGGGDNIAVAWQGGPIATRQVITADYVGPTPNLPLKAYAPGPGNGATDVIETVTLGWSAGEKAAQHDVFLGTDRTAVANATTATTGIYRGRQNLAATTYVPTESPLLWDTTYYWRVDEINSAEPEGPWKGNIWSFTTANFIVVDDFEDYDDWCNRVFYKWTDGWGYSADPTCGVVASGGNGTGSTVGNLNPPFAEQTIVHSGGQQSMPFEYDNSGAAGKARYSETLRQWASPQDWTKNNVKALTLYVRGNPPDFIESPPGTFMMSAEGTDIWGGTDEFRYVYKQLSGNGEIIARVDRIAGPGTNEWAKAGVMIRETLVGTSKHAFMAVTPLASHGLAFQYRDGIDADDSDSEHGVDNQTAPYWVKLVRQGNVFTGYHSPDGINWTMKDPSGTEDDAMNPVTIPMAANVYIGLALTSHENDVLRMAQFSNVSTTGSVTGAWTVIDIDSTVVGTNSIEPLYVALEDSAGKVKAVPTDNPLGSADPDWQEWNIKLSDFSGAAVNLKAVKKMYIGVGTRGSTMVGGSGKIYVDDIRVYPSRCVPSFGKPANDLSGNCVVDYADLEIMASDWLGGAGLAGDLNADGDVDLADYAFLADTWLDELLWP
jgi:hypothetical protein